LRTICYVFDIGAEAERRSLEQPNPVGSSLVGLYVGNLHPTIFDADLRSLFMKFGSIKSAYVIKAKHKSKCYGFVVFHTAQSAAQAMREMDGVLIKSCAIRVNYADRQPCK
jgi:RNA recognition motif-containing protein